MTDTTKAPPLTLDDWLKSLGFHDGNPFATSEADRERELLPQCFVDVDSYDLIKGDQTVIVFAPRGGGKSSLRVMLASEGAPWSPGSENLTVECTDFDPLVTLWQNNHPLIIQEYVDWLLPISVKALFDTFLPENKQGTISTNDKNYTNHLSRFKWLTPPVRVHFSRLLHSYHSSLLSVETIGRHFAAHIPTFAKYNWMQFVQAVQEHHLRQFIETHGLDDNSFITLLADLNDYAELATCIPNNTPRARLVDFVQLARDMGFTAVHFLLDRLDETIATADNPQAQADVLEPLLAHLPILEMPGVAFKFFLSKKTRDVLWERPTVRQEDRLAEHAVTLKWDTDRLKELLDARLQAYSDFGVPSLSSICVQKDDEIEKAMITRSQNSPRRLLIAGRLLFEAALTRYQDTKENVLRKEDWLRAEKSLLQKFPPQLQINLDERLVYINSQSVRLSSNEAKIMTALIDNNTLCTYDDLALAVWESLHTDNQTMNQAISRLRKKIKDVAAPYAYIKTIHGQGFQLENYELV